MNKNLLIGLAVCTAISGIAQQNSAKPKAGSIIDMSARLSKKFDINRHLNENVNGSKIKTSNSNTSASDLLRSSSSGTLISANFTRISGSMNAFGVLTTNQKPLSYNDQLNTVSFIHRKSITYNPSANGNSGTIVGMIGRNMGSNWDSTCIWADGTYPGRYPQGGMYNPPGNTNPNNAYLIATGPVVSGAGWIGSFYGSKKINATGTNAPGTDMQFFANTGTFSTTTSPTMTKHDFPRNHYSATDDGVVRVAGSIVNDVNATDASYGLRGGLVAKGSFNAGVFVWTPDSLKPPYVMKSDGTPQAWDLTYMAWNETGTVGYVMFIGSRQGQTNSNKGWQPIIYKTTNSGGSWALLNAIDFNASGWSFLKNSIQSVNTNTTLEIPFFNVGEGIDLVVDKNNKLHIVSTVVGTTSSHNDSLSYTYQFPINGENYSFGFAKTAWPYLFDFTGDSTGAWTYKVIDSLSTEGPSDVSGEPGFSTNPWANAGQSDPVASDSRIQVSRSNNGEYIIYSWAESDTTLTTGAKKWNEFPNVKVRAQRISDGIVSCDEINITGPSVGFNPRVKDKAFFHYLSTSVKDATVSSSTTTFTIPVTVSNNTGLDGISPVDHFYGNAIATYSFSSGPCLVTGIKAYSNNVTESKLFPNPAKNQSNLSIYLNDNSAIGIEIYDAVGKLVTTNKFNGILGENVINIDLQGLNSGIYFIKVKNGPNASTKKLIVE